MAGNAIQPVMIPADDQAQGPGRWQQQMQQAWRDPRALLDHLGLDPDSFGLDRRPGFPFLVTRDFAARMRRGDPADPLLRQVLPLDDEREPRSGFDDDPVGDAGSRAVDGVLHKYRGRALLIAHGACPIHCRYCFRREFDYAVDRLDSARLAAAVDYIAGQDDITEVILSGGDPLMLNDRRLQCITDAVGTVPHVQRIRIHTRVPITLPDRIDAGFMDWLAGIDRQVVVVVHANHAREFDDRVAAALARLRPGVSAIFNQAVLLAGVNDRAETLAALMEAAFACGVIPYYLHLLDRVSGSAHYEVGETRALELVEALRTELPGYLVPRLVRERAGEPYKLPVY